MKNTKIPRISPAKRLLYAFVGLLAGDLILLFFLLQHALHATLLAGEPARTIADTVQTFILYAIFSFVGWVFVGLPGTLLFPARSITRLSWPQALDFGRYFWPDRSACDLRTTQSKSHLLPQLRAEMSTLLAYTILVSTVSFMGYLALLRKEMRSNPIPVTTLLPSVVMGLSVRLLRASA